jgi:hypothetical protein
VVTVTSTAKVVSPSPRRALRASLHALIDALPDADEWTHAERSRWLEAVWGILGFAISTTDEPTPLLSGVEMAFAAPALASVHAQSKQAS